MTTYGYQNQTVDLSLQESLDVQTEGVRALIPFGDTEEIPKVILHCEVITGNNVTAISIERHNILTVELMENGIKGIWENGYDSSVVRGAISSVII